MHRSVARIALALALVLCSATPHAMGKTEALILETGESRVLTLAKLDRVAIGDPKIADVKALSKTEVMIVGKSEGGTTLHTWSGKTRSVRQIYVYPRSTRSIAEEITRAVGLPGVEARAAGPILVLSGEVATEGQRQEVLKTAGHFGREIMDLLKVAPELYQVQVQVKMVEASREAMKELGVDWKQTPDGVGLANLYRAVTSGNPTDLLLQKVRAWIDEGTAKLLAEPNLVTVVGSSASFLAGGEIPIPVTLDGQTSVQWKPYGVSLSVTPKLGPSGSLVVKVHPEVTTLDWSNATTGGTSSLPALRRRFADTELRVTPGDSIVIAGLLQSEDTKVVSRLPLLGSLPIIGELFKSTRYVNKETELIVIVTPSIYVAQKAAK